MAGAAEATHHPVLAVPVAAAAFQRCPRGAFGSLGAPHGEAMESWLSAPTAGDLKEPADA